MLTHSLAHSMYMYVCVCDAVAGALLLLTLPPVGSAVMRVLEPACALLLRGVLPPQAESESGSGSRSLQQAAAATLELLRGAVSFLCSRAGADEQVVDRIVTGE
jgi:hypothetical protein